MLHLHSVYLNNLTFVIFAWVSVEIHTLINSNSNPFSFCLHFAVYVHEIRSQGNNMPKAMCYSKKSTTSASSLDRASWWAHRASASSGVAFHFSWNILCPQFGHFLPPERKYFFRSYYCLKITLKIQKVSRSCSFLFCFIVSLPNFWLQNIFEILLLLCPFDAHCSIHWISVLVTNNSKKILDHQYLFILWSTNESC